MKYQSYELTPIEAAKATNLEQRSLYPMNIRWDCNPPNNPSNAYKIWVRFKPHSEYMIQLFGVLSTDELYRIRVAIQDELVAPFFNPIVGKFYETKTNSGFLTEVILPRYELFIYNDKQKFMVPTEKVHSQRKLIVSVPEVHPNIPVATSEQIRQILQKPKGI